MMKMRRPAVASVQQQVGTWVAVPAWPPPLQQLPHSVAADDAPSNTAVAAGDSRSNTATALASAQGDYVEGQGSSSEEGGDDVTIPPPRPSTRIGQAMEIQGCEPDSCDYICTECDWEACIVEADDGTVC